MSASAEGEKILFKIQELKELALSFCTPFGRDVRSTQPELKASWDS